MAGLLLLLLLRPVFFWVLFLCFPESVVVQAQATLTPAAIPLAVRSPYFSCWEPSLNGSKWSGVWSTTFAGNAILGWAGLAKVDGVAYTFLGDQIGNPSFPGAKQTNLTQTTITPTRSIFNIQAGPVELILTFLSPIEPGDWVRQSMPFSYMSVDVQSLDGNSHRVQVYSDISGEWNSGDRGQPITWTTSATSDTVFHAVTLQNQAPFVEIQNQAEWGTLYIAAKAGSAVTYKTASDEVSRPEFITQGVLDNQLDTNFRTIPGSPGNTFPVFAISLDFGNIQSSQNPAVWAFGYSRDPALQYTDLSGQTTTRSLFYKTKYPKDSDTVALITDFLNDFPNAQTRAAQLDSKIMGDGASISSNYSDLLALSARQAYGATELTVGQNADGSPNPSDVMMFMKNIGGTIPGRINAVETLYAAFPMFMYMDPSLGAPLLEPLLRFQNSPNYTVGFAAADVGSKYPNATASNQQHQQSVEQSGNMLIMSYAYARASGDGSLLSKYYPLFKTWADFLVNNTLFISGQQLSGDNESGNNQTNLALKGIIAVQAMSGISAALNRSADMQAYASKASNLIQQWNSFALSDDKHLLAKYGDPSSSWTLGYNLFADSWLGTNLLDSSVLAGHTQFLATLQSQGITPTQFGVPIDSTNMAASFSTWNLFSAAIATDTTVRDGLISGVHNRATMNASAGAFPVTYDSSRGSTILGTASPAQGAMYAQLALKIPVSAIEVNFTGPAGGQPFKDSQSSKQVNTGAIVGAVFGGLAILIALGLIAWFLRRRQQHPRVIEIPSEDMLESAGARKHQTLTPFRLGDDQSQRSDELLPNPFGESEMSHTTYSEARGSDSDQPFLPQTASDAATLTRVPFAPPLVPTGLSDKALARLRMENSSMSTASSRAHLWNVSDSSGGVSPESSLGEPLPVASGSGARPLPPPPIPPTPLALSAADTTSDLRVEVEYLRREMQQIREERLEPPPMYYAGDSAAPSQ